MVVHSADKLAEMRTKFHVIQAKMIMSIWCFTVHWHCIWRHNATSGIVSGAALRSNLRPMLLPHFSPDQDPPPAGIK